MFHFLLLTISLLTGQAWANEIPKSFSYLPTLQMEMPGSKTLAAIESALDLEPLVAVRDTGSTEVSSTSFDQIYVSSDFSKVIFIKLGLRPKRSSYFGRVFDHPDGQLVHVLVDNQWSVSVFFRNFSKTEVTRLAALLAKNLSKLSPSSTAQFHRSGLLDFLLPQAEAQTCSNDENRAPVLSLRAVNQRMDRQQQASVAGSCLASAWDGMRSGVLSRLTNLRDTVYQLTHDPIQAWHSAVESFTELSRFLANFRTEIAGVIRAGIDISQELNSEIFCAFVGELSPDIILLIAGGYGSARLALAITNYARRISQIQKFLSLVSRLSSVGQNRQFLQPFLRRLIRGEIGPDELRSIERFSEREASELAMGAAQCVP